MAPRATCSGRPSPTCADRDRGVRLIGIAATNLGVAAEADLFEPPARQRLRDLSAAVDQLREKFGFGAVTPGSALRARRRPRE